MKERAPALIIAPSGPLRDSLQAFLLTLAEVRLAEDVPSALRAAAEHPPGLVLVDGNLPGDGAPLVLKQMKAQGFFHPCLVLAEDPQQQQAVATEADVVLLKGVPAARLLGTIKGLLSNSI